MKTDIFRVVQLLLPKYQCVVIPNLGAFILNRGIRNSSLEAPVYQLSFNGQLLHDDGVLASFYQQQQNISYDKALSELSQSVKDLKISLFSDGELQCGTLGNLTSEGDAIVFKPNTSFVVPISFGLTEVKLQTLSQINREIKREEVLKKKTLFKQNLLSAVAGAAVVLLFFLPSNTIKDSTQDIEQAGFLESIASSVYGSNSSNNAEETINKEIYYYLIIAGDPSKDRANKMLRSIQKEQGFESASIVSVNNRHRIYTQIFSNKQDADRAVAQLIKNNPRYASAWIYTDRVH